MGSYVVIVATGPFLTMLNKDISFPPVEDISLIFSIPFA